ncbi:ThuA domain-containing protein [Paenibacillus tarimensis]|uniref:ThuA domain-containing protein n=1 Tax=Paenibacillus tarimensis TaxID=416012 RepID=UPI001F3F52D5|nr:ThuA domain-containing protein [Paenibacillus tarimensis]MCF2944292.1 ThuA domain-containing protein [Paenibacillus tarimensis]
MDKRLFAVLGDHWHDPALSEEALRLAVKEAEAALGVSIAVEIVPAQDLAGRLGERPDAVVLYKEDRLNPLDETVRTWMTPETAREITRYVSEGGCWLAWHSGLAGYDREGYYIRMLSGYFEHHPEMQAVTYTRAGGRGQKADTGEAAAVFWDEHYFVHCNVEATNVWLISTSADGRSEAGWRHPYGEGRVSCLTPAHSREALTDPDFISLLAGELTGLLEDKKE